MQNKRRKKRKNNGTAILTLLLITGIVIAGGFALAHLYLLRLGAFLLRREGIRIAASHQKEEHT